MAPRDNGGGDDGGGFLTRWSRRKREAVAEKGTSKAHADVADPLPPACGGEGLGTGGRAGQGSTDVPSDGLDSPPHTGPLHRKRREGEEVEMIEPPSLDLVDKDFDVAHWLKQNVPESWKLAAMRRAWESDPAIAGYENPARDYALDWNTPGGAPGYGPLSESDDVAEMLRGIFGEPPRPPPPESVVAEATGDSMPHQIGAYDESRNDDVAAQQIAQGEAERNPVRLSEDVPEEPKAGENPPVASGQVYAAAQKTSLSDGPAVRIRKRGGGATPV